MVKKTKKSTKTTKKAKITKQTKNKAEVKAHTWDNTKVNSFAEVTIDICSLKSCDA